ncbi:hypothetical protein CS542_03500 [Pedobacter sp. IW39]|nr:hypothetical protein CS542_03500 [Pedobacter sp. IW39]
MYLKIPQPEYSGPHSFTRSLPLHFKRYQSPATHSSAQIQGQTDIGFLLGKMIGERMLLSDQRPI